MDYGSAKGHPRPLGPKSADIIGSQNYEYAYRCERCICNASIFGTCTKVRLGPMEGGTILERCVLGDLTVGCWQPQERTPAEKIGPEWFVDCSKLMW